MTKTARRGSSSWSEAPWPGAEGISSVKCKEGNMRVRLRSCANISVSHSLFLTEASRKNAIAFPGVNASDRRDELHEPVHLHTYLLQCR